MTVAAGTSTCRVQSLSAWRAVALRAGVLVLGAVTLGVVHIPHRPPTLCLLRALTGVPCPFCGGTTAGVRLGHGDVLGAFLANPLVVAGAVFLVLSPVAARLPLRAWWIARSGRTKLALVVAALGCAELWQLFRFGLLPLP